LHYLTLEEAHIRQHVYYRKDKGAATNEVLGFAMWLTG